MTKLLPIQVPKQDGDFLCWAAVTAGVRKYYFGDVLKQCFIAGTMLNRACCPKPEPCDEPHRLDWTLAKFDCLAQDPIGGPLPPQVVVHQIATLGLPICAQIARPGSTHFVVIAGVKVSHNAMDLAVWDPLTGPATHPYAQFVDNYQNQGGRWVFSYFTTKVTS